MKRRIIEFVLWLLNERNCPCCGHSWNHRTCDGFLPMDNIDWSVW